MTAKQTFLSGLNSISNINLLQSEQSLQASIYTREAHEGKAEESSCNHHDGHALHTLRNANQSLLLTNASEDNESQGKAKSCREIGRAHV